MEEVAFRILCLESMRSKFERCDNVVQIGSVQLEHGCRRLRKWDRSRKDIRRERKGLFLQCAKKIDPNRSRKATVRHDTDEDRREYKSLPLSGRHDVEDYSPEEVTDETSPLHSKRPETGF